MFLTNLCLFFAFAFAVFSYEPFVNLNGLQSDTPQWITIPENDHTCNLKVKQNWPDENHRLIVGDEGTIAEPKGDYAKLARYYVKKRELNANRIQFVALLNPIAFPVSVDDPDRFSRQIFALFCQQGTMDAIDMKTRVIGAWTRGKCDIEVKFVEFCLLDQNVGTLPLHNIEQLFEAQIPNTHRVQANVDDYFLMARLTCVRFVGMKLPGKRVSAKVAATQIGYYLKGAKRANFGRVLMQGITHGDLLKGENCQDGNLCWAHYSVDKLIQDTNLVERLYTQTKAEILPRVWYFCKEFGNPASRRTNLNRFHWLLIEYHHASRHQI